MVGFGNRISGLHVVGVVAMAVGMAPLLVEARMSRRRNAPLKGARPIGSNMTEVEHGDLTILYSYETPVAFLSSKGGYRTEKQWSRTTSKHIGKFFARHGYDLKGAFKIPQDDLALFVEQGSLAGSEMGAGRVTRGNPHDPLERAHAGRGYAFSGANLGVFIDGAYGEDHALEVMAGLLQRVTRSMGGTGTWKQANDLLAEYDDDKIDDEFTGEWLDDATDVLQEATAPGVYWTWEAGDLILHSDDEEE